MSKKPAYRGKYVELLKPRDEFAAGTVARVRTIRHGITSLIVGSPTTWQRFLYDVPIAELVLRPDYEEPLPCKHLRYAIDERSRRLIGERLWSECCCLDCGRKHRRYAAPEETCPSLPPTARGRGDTNVHFARDEALLHRSFYDAEPVGDEIAQRVRERR